MDNFVADAIFIDAPPERVFNALLDPAGAAAWLEAEGVRIEPRVGGRFEARSALAGEIHAVIRSSEPGRELLLENFTQVQDGLRRGPMELRFTLEPRLEGVWLVVRQEHLDCCPDWKQYAPSARKILVRMTVALKRWIEGI